MHAHTSRLLRFLMFSVSPVSYEHPRRMRPFVSSAEKLKNSHSDHYFAFESRVSSIEESIARIETSLSQKVETLTSRLDKVSDLSIASSRAVAAISSQFEEFKSEVQAKVGSMVNMEDVKRAIGATQDNLLADMKKLIDERNCDCERYSKRQADILDRIEVRHSKLELEQRGVVDRIERDLRDVHRDMSDMTHRIESSFEILASISEEMRLVAENVCDERVEKAEDRIQIKVDSIESSQRDLGTDIRSKISSIENKQFEQASVDKERHEELSAYVNDHMSALRHHVVQLDRKFSSDASLEHLRSELRTEIASLRSSLETAIQQALSSSSNSPAVASTNSLVTQVSQLNTLLSEMNTSTIPGIYREMESRMSVFEFRAENKTIELMKELCTEMESDISRIIELIHSVYVQAGLPMPAGTLSSWKRFREIMFDKENIGPGFVGRRPILGEAIMGHLQQNKPTPTGRATSITRYRP